MIKDIVAARQKVVDNLEDHGYRPRDADPTDFQVGNDRTLRFKVGTQHSEITVTVWREDQSVQTLRAVTEEQVVELNHSVDRQIAKRGNR